MAGGDLADAGHAVATDEVLKRLNRRDHLDSTRETSPAVQAADAELLDTTGLSVDQVVDMIVTRVEAV